MRKYLYTTLLLALLAQEGVMAQENEGKKGGFFGKIKDTFSTEIKIGNYTFKDGSVYTGEMKGRKPNGKGKTVFKNIYSVDGVVDTTNEDYNGLRNMIKSINIDASKLIK